MSLDALIWAIRVRATGGVSESALRTLAVLADYAGEGHQCFPSWRRIQEDRGISRATVNRHLAELHTAGLIGPGDSRLVSHLPSNRRPRVWALNVNNRGFTYETTDDPRGLSFDLPGVSSGERTVIGRTAIEPSNSPSVRTSRARATAAAQVVGYPGRECAHGFSADVHVNPRTGATEPLCPMCRRKGRVILPTEEEGARHAGAA